MNKSQITFSILGLLIAIMASTNPSTDEHRSAVLNKLKQEYSKENESRTQNAFEKLGENIGFGIAKGIIDNLVTRDNFFVFSLTKIEIQDEEKIIGVGLFGAVWIKPDFNKDKLNGRWEEVGETNASLGVIFLVFGLILTPISLLGKYNFETKHFDQSEMDSIVLLAAITSIITGLFFI